jgi:hypothetical protein
MRGDQDRWCRPGLLEELAAAFTANVRPIRVAL